MYIQHLGGKYQNPLNEVVSISHAVAFFFTSNCFLNVVHCFLDMIQNEMISQTENISATILIINYFSYLSSNDARHSLILASQMSQFTALMILN